MGHEIADTRLMLLREPARPGGGARRGADSRGARRHPPLTVHRVHARAAADL